MLIIQMHFEDQDEQSTQLARITRLPLSFHQ